MLRAQGLGHVPRVATSVSVTHCDRVQVTAMAFDGARSLWSVNIASVDRLEMADEAFGWSDNGNNNNPQQQHHHQAGLTVTITNVTTVPEVPSYAFRGRLRAVVFNGVRVLAVRPFAFSSLTGITGRIEFRDTVFALVEQQAFKKFTVNEFVMRGCRFEGPAPSRMLTEITVHDELRLEDVAFAVVRSYAFRVHGPRVFRVRGSRAACVQSAAFEVKCRGPAFVEDNAFGRLERGAFAAVTVDARAAARLHDGPGGGGGGGESYQEFVFENNTVAEYEDDALVFDTNGFRPRLDWLIVGRACACPARWRTDLVAFATDYPRHADRPAWTVEQAAWCSTPPDDGDPGRLVRAQLYDEAHCGGLGGGGGGGGAGGGGRSRGLGGVARFCATAGAVLAVAALAAALVYWAWHKRRKRTHHRWTNVPTTASSPLKTAGGARSILKGVDRTRGGGGGGSRHVMVMPEGKTYRETELHVIVETAAAADDPHRYTSTTDYRQHRAHPLTSDL